jgi:nucleoside-diphosphate-sugar epimerase
MDKILVTCGAGYIGSVLVGYLLKQDYSVTVVDNLLYGQRSLLQYCMHPKFDFVRGDVRDETLMHRLVKTHDAIIALAAIVSPKACERDPIAAQTVNLDSIVMLNRIRSIHQPVIFPNTNIGYGTKSGELYCNEKSPMQPNSIYGITKIKAEEELLSSPNSISLRLASLFGPSPHMKTHLLLNFFVYKAISDGCLVIYEKDFKRNFLHVDDISEAFCFSLKHFDKMKGEAYNVGFNDANLTKAELAEKVKEHIPSVYIQYADINSDPDKRNYIVSNSKINEKGFVARRSIDDGIKQLMKIYQMISTDFE